MRVTVSVYTTPQTLPYASSMLALLAHGLFYASSILKAMSSA
jgi:hypothetical protein